MYSPKINERMIQDATQLKMAPVGPKYAANITTPL